VRDIVASIEVEYRRYKGLAEGALAQLSEEELGRTAGAEGNSVITLVQHVGGNLRSRFTEFLTADGEKPWRDRESEFVPRASGPAELRRGWEEGFAVLFGALAALSDADLGRPVSIRGEALTVHAALHRSLAHTSYHAGQIVFLAKSIRGEGWRCLSVPRGGGPPSPPI
jgi:hypothetical protein